MSAPLSETPRRVNERRRVRVLKHQLQHVGTGVVKAQLREGRARENTNAFTELRRIVGLGTVKDRGGEQIRHLPAVDDNIPARQPVHDIGLQTTHVRGVGALRDLIRVGAVHRAIGAKGAGEVQCEEVRLHFNGDRIARAALQREGYNVYACNIRREGRRERCRVRERRAAALREADELPQVAGVDVGRGTAAGQRDHGAQLDGLIRPGIDGGRRSGLRRGRRVYGRRARGLLRLGRGRRRSSAVSHTPGQQQQHRYHEITCHLRLSRSCTIPYQPSSFGLSRAKV